MEIISTTTRVSTTVETVYATKYKDLTIIKTVTNDGEPYYRLNRIKDDNKKYGHLTFVKPEFFEFIKTKDPHRRYDGLSSWGWELFVIDEHKISVEEIYNLIEKDQFVYWYGSGHQIFDSKKNILPFARHFDYISHIFHNGHAKLPELLEYLKTHDWVINKENVKITDIPYYNSDESHSKMIEVIIKPDNKSFQAMYERCKDKDNWSTHMDDYVKSYCITKKYDPMGLLPFLKNKNK